MTLNKKALVEAVLLASRGVNIETLKEVVSAPEEEILSIIEELKREYSSEEHGVELKEIEGFYRFYTKPEYFKYVSKVVKRRNLGNLSSGQLEIAIFLAVRKNATKLEIDSMRGKDSAGLLKQMLESGIIRRKKQGRTFVYYLTETFKEETMIEDLIKKAGGASFDSLGSEIFVEKDNGEQ